MQQADKAIEQRQARPLGTRKKDAARGMNAGSSNKFQVRHAAPFPPGLNSLILASDTLLDAAQLANRRICRAAYASEQTEAPLVTHYAGRLWINSAFPSAGRATLSRTRTYVTKHERYGGLHHWCD